MEVMRFYAFVRERRDKSTQMLRFSLSDSLMLSLLLLVFVVWMTIVR